MQGRKLWTVGWGTMLPLFLSCSVLGVAAAHADEGQIAPERSVERMDPVEAEREREREQLRRLGRAWQDHQARHAESTARSEAQQAREREAAQLRGSLTSSARRESALRHDRYWAHREYDAMSRDPGDLSGMARRGALEREMQDLRSQLGTATTAREFATRRLDTLRLR